MNHATLTKFDDDKRIVYGVVYAPNMPDSQGDFMTAEQIERMAHQFLASGSVRSIDTEHNLQDNGCAVVESFVARKSDPDFPEGAWVMGVFIPDDDLWVAVKKNELAGFSMYGRAERTECTIEIEVPEDGVLEGDTFEQEHHVHKYALQFDTETGQFLGGVTDEVDGHFHLITKGTVTESAGAEPHSHRFSFMEKLT